VSEHTVAANIASTLGGNLQSVTPITLQNTLVAHGQALQGADIIGTVASLDNNLIQQVAGASFTGPSEKNLIGRDPLLGPLQDNGGLTPTMALQPGSPAIDHMVRDDSPVRTDQRSLPRGYDGFCDIGAFEVQSTG